MGPFVLPICQSGQLTAASRWEQARPRYGPLRWTSPSWPRRDRETRGDFRARPPLAHGAEPANRTDLSRTARSIAAFVLHCNHLTQPRLKRIFSAITISEDSPGGRTSDPEPGTRLAQDSQRARIKR